MVIKYITAEVQKLHEEGYSIRSIALQLGISKSSVGRIVKAMQDHVSGTGNGTSPKSVVGTANMPLGTTLKAVPTASWDTGGAQNSGMNSENDDKLTLLADTKVDFSFYEEFRLTIRKEFLESRYSNFLHYMDEFLGSILSSEESALSLIKNRQSILGEFVVYAGGVCSDCQVLYGGLHMAYVLEQLDAFLGQQPELEKVNYGVKIKDFMPIRLLLRKAAELDVFSLRLT